MKFFIDVFEKDEEVIEYLGDKIEEYQFVNILEYIKEVYDIGFINLSRIFNVQRQTIYNYSHGTKSDELNENVKSILCEIYEVKNFNELLKREKNLFIYGEQEKELVFTSHDSDPKLEDGLIYYEISYDFNGFIDPKLNDTYDFKYKFKNYLEEVNNDLIVKFDYNDLKDVIAKNERHFNMKLINVLKQLEPNDYEALKKLESTKEIKSKNLKQYSEVIAEIFETKTNKSPSVYLEMKIRNLQSIYTLKLSELDKFYNENKGKEDTTFNKYVIEMIFSDYNDVLLTNKIIEDIMGMEMFVDKEMMLPNNYYNEKLDESMVKIYLFMED